MTELKSVVVLTTSDKPFSLLNNTLGYTRRDPLMCLAKTPTKVFHYQVLPLVANSKVVDYAKSANIDGIVIMLDKYDNQVIQLFLEALKDKPVLIVSDNPNNYTGQFAQLNLPRVRYFYLVTSTDQYQAITWYHNQLIKPRSVIKPATTSVTISTPDLAKQFALNTLPISIWDHYGRLRIVHYALTTYGLADTVNPTGWLCTNWRAYKSSINHGHLWNYSLTRFWIHVICDLLNKKTYGTFHDFYTANPFIHDGKLHQSYYSDDVIFSAQAKSTWVPPNLQRLL